MDFQQVLQAINGIGTLLVAVVVAVIGYRQFRSQQAQNNFQNRIVEQDLRIKLLEQRAGVIDDFRTIYSHYFKAAGLDDDGISKMLSVSQRGALLFHSNISNEINELTDDLLKHKIVSRRVAALLEHDPRGIYQQKVEEQMNLEDSIWDKLTPLLATLVSEAKVQLD
jgi:hypothetical protein